MYIARRLAIAALVFAAPWIRATTEVSASPGDADALDTQLVAQETGGGPAAINDTAVRWNVWGTDLGHMFEFRDRIYMVFGDPFGPPGRPAPDYRRRLPLHFALQYTVPVSGCARPRTGRVPIRHPDAGAGIGSISS